jgi:hypothetical protein
LGTRPIIIQDGGGGMLTFSPDGSRLIRYHPYDDGFFLFDFDRTTGQLGNYRRIPVYRTVWCWMVGRVFPLREGFCMWALTGICINMIWNPQTLKGSEVHIAHYDGYRSKGIFRAMIGRMQWGPDCKIYVNCRSSMDALHVIHRPNEKGIACDFRPHELKVATDFTEALFPIFQITDWDLHLYVIRNLRCLLARFLCYLKYMCFLILHGIKYI